ncbi:MAG: GAF domain-containing protein [Chloroflexota bacterium]
MTQLLPSETKEMVIEEPINANRQLAINLLLPALCVALFGGLLWVLLQYGFTINGRVIYWASMLVVASIVSWLKTMAYEWRALTFSLITLLIGMDLFFTAGPVAWGVLVLTCVPMLTTLFLGKWHGLILAIVTIGILITPSILDQRIFWAGAQPINNGSLLLIVIIFALTAMSGQLSLDRLLKQGELAETLSTELVNTLEIENKLINEKVLMRSETIRTISTISQKISPILEEQILVQETVKQLQENKNYFYAQIYLLEELTQSETLFLAADVDRTGKSFQQYGHRIPKYHGLIGQTLLKKSTLIENNLSAADPNILGETIQQASAAMIVPIFSGEDLLGVIDIRQDATNSFDEDDLFLVEAVADQLAIGLRNARLYTRAQQQAMREVLVNSIREQLQAAETVNEALEIATKAISRELNTSAQINIGLQV